MARGKSVLDGLKRNLEKGVRRGLNQVLDRVNDFESRGGMRGAVERTRARSERATAKLIDALEDRGIQFDFERFVPLSLERSSELAKHYRTLGVPIDSDMDAVKSAYRAQMREHHPDKHAGNPAREKEATRRSQDLTLAYDAIEEHLKRTQR
ncbi:MAG: hypothetical protein AUK47_01420 [Deltaproteobacteria bacterium CG2_30_63_29]|nr:MAG: hypothetical protein AUK47_01420 [Deltaproteobacteria bacterium CG2_30_63_29]PJB47432.1 MAG: hypothetical protein CO108_04190 [Deltaproteobacteria bacterium CG_4_9_14_3_um_filter_63_12]